MTIDKTKKKTVLMRALSIDSSLRKELEAYLQLLVATDFDSGRVCYDGIEERRTTEIRSGHSKLEPSEKNCTCGYN